MAGAEQRPVCTVRTPFFILLIRRLFGPLEQMIVAVVITGLGEWNLARRLMVAMNPGLLPQMRPQIPAAFPIQGVPVYHPQVPALPPPSRSPVTQPPPVAVNITALAINETSLGSIPSSTGHPLLDLLPSWRPNPIVISLVILLISVLIHLIPRHVFRRVKHSWVIFWPPWQDRTNPPQASRSGPESAFRSTAGDVPKPKEARALAQDPGGSKAEARAGPSSPDSMDDEGRRKREDRRW
jgi:hypothetical protein